MARGQAGAAQGQLDKTNIAAASQGGQASQLENQLIPGYTSLMDTGYMSPEEQNAATTSEMGSATAPFASAGFQAKNDAANTKNASNLPAQEDQLALEEGQAAGGAAANLQNQKMQNQEAGMSGLEGLESGNLGAMESLYGLGPGTLQARAAGKSGDEIADSYINTGLSAAKLGQGMASGGCWIAAELYGGWNEPRTVAVRHWLNTEFVKRPIGRMVMAVYLRFGERIAAMVKRSSLLRQMLEPLFDLALEKANGR